MNMSASIIPGTTEPNELDVEFLSVHGLNPFVRHNSSPRLQMMSSHLTQRLVIKGATERIIQTGVEQELGKYTFSTKMPVNGKIIKVIDRYPKNLSVDSIAFNPESLVIYEDDDTKEIGCFFINYYKSYHQYFGFKNKFNEQNISKLSPGNFVAKDTIFADSPAVTEEGGYAYGINLNMAFMSHPAVSEDGILISRDALDKLSFKVFETRVAEFGNHSFPLNLYGTVNNYKPFPDIGEVIREDGLLMMLRDYDMDICPVNMSIYDVMEPDYIFDKAIYVRGCGGKIIDIKIYHDENSISTTPIGIEEFLTKYLKAKKTFYKELMETINGLKALSRKKFNNNKLKLKPELHRLIVEALSNLDEGGEKSNQKLNHIHRKDPLDDYRIEFTIEYTITPDVGFKLTDINGGKGVICALANPEDMPIDSNGNRAEIVMDAYSTLSRMNIGRLYEMYIQGSARDTAKIIKDTIEQSVGTSKYAINSVQQFYNKDVNAFNNIYSYLLGFYNICSPKQHQFFSSLSNDSDKIEHIADCISKGIILYIPPNNDRETDMIVKLLEQHYRPTYGPVSYVGLDGERVTTFDNVRIAPLYMMLLEKIGDDWASVSSGRLQHFGVLSPMTKNEKYSMPFRNSPVRTIGETEGRIFVSYCGREAVAEMMDRNNSPVTHKAVVNSILTSTHPSNIDVAVDRNIIQLGASKPLAIMNHISLCAGWKLKHD